jgi:hypothetical protein
MNPAGNKNHNGELRNSLVRESALIAALERKPEVAIPTDFMSRLSASLPAERRTPSARRISFARAAAYVAAACLAAFLIVLTRLHPDAIAAPSGMPFVMEIIILTQLMAIGFWLGTRSDG